MSSLNARSGNKINVGSKMSMLLAELPPGKAPIINKSLNITGFDEAYSNYASNTVNLSRKMFIYSGVVNSKSFTKYIVHSEYKSVYSLIESIKEVNDWKQSDDEMMLISNSSGEKYFDYGTGKLETATVTSLGKKAAQELGVCGNNKFNIVSYSANELIDGIKVQQTDEYSGNPIESNISFRFSQDNCSEVNINITNQFVVGDQYKLKKNLLNKDQILQLIKTGKWRYYSLYSVTNPGGENGLVSMPINELHIDSVERKYFVTDGSYLVPYLEFCATTKKTLENNEQDYRICGATYIFD